MARRWWWLALACGCHHDAVATSQAWQGASSSGAADTSTGDGTGTSTGTSTTATGGSDTSVDDTGTTGEPYDGPIVYPFDRVHSPITPHVAEHLRTLAAAGDGLADDVFMKVGASTEVNTNNLYCFADADAVQLGDHEALAPTLARFRGGDADGTTPFDRASLAAEVGRGAGWAITGDPSPLTAELAAISPALALVHYGTNDMQLGITHASALPPFYDAMGELLDTLELRGVVPVVLAIMRRGDDPAANRWVPVYNAALRATAQARQIPLIDTYLAIDSLPGHGLGADGLHLEPDPDGACLLTEAGLEHGYNRRNLAQLELLARSDRVLVDGTYLDEVDASWIPADAPGTLDAPVPITTLPFADARDTSLAVSDAIDGYPGCDDTDESGPEVVYALELDAPTRVRIVALDRAGVDVDVHLLDGPSGDDCVVRDDTWIGIELAAGSHRIVVDTWSSAGFDYAGAYVLVVVPCADDDPECVPP